MLYRPGKKWIPVSKTDNLNLQQLLLTDTGDKDTKRAARIPIPYF